MARVDVLMPQMGESIAEGTVSKWLKKLGDPVKRYEPLFEISTDKVDAEIPSPTAGVLAEIKVQEGQTVPVQTLVAVIETEKGAAVAAAPAPAPSKPAPAPPPTSPVIPRPAPSSPVAPKGGDGTETADERDRKSTRLNSSHMSISYAVFCLKKKKIVGRLILKIGKHNNNII